MILRERCPDNAQGTDSNYSASTREGTQYSWESQPCGKGTERWMLVDDVSKPGADAGNDKQANEPAHGVLLSRQHFC